MTNYEKLQEKIDEKNCEIVGTASTLQDLLLALKQSNQKHFVEFCNCIWRWNIDNDYDLPAYDLTKPFPEQSEDFYEWALNVLNEE